MPLAALVSGLCAVSASGIAPELPGVLGTSTPRGLRAWQRGSSPQDRHHIVSSDSLARIREHLGQQQGWEIQGAATGML